jgi:hypothetical protein
MVKGSVIGLPILDGGNFTGTGGNVQVWFKFYTCVAFICTRLDTAEDPLIVDTSTSNGFVVKSTGSSGSYNWIAVGHG